MVKAVDLVRKLVAKHPDAPAMTLARWLHRDYPAYFGSVEKARGQVRYVLGLHGKKNLPHATHKRKKRKAGAFSIPRGINKTPKPLNITDPGKWLLFSDTHVPYQDHKAFGLALEYGVKAGCKHVYINGDFYDFHRISRWNREPGSVSPKRELEIGRPILEQIAQSFPGRKIFKIGNHEARYEAYLAQNCEELAECEQFRIGKFLGLEELGYEMISNRQEASLGNLAIYHGDELPKGLTDPVNVARGVFLRVQESALVGHWHRTSHHVETSARKGTMVSCYSVGCLCNLKPNYAPVNRWNNGFAVIHLEEGWTYRVENKIILKGKVY